MDGWDVGDHIVGVVIERAGQSGFPVAHGEGAGADGQDCAPPAKSTPARAPADSRGLHWEEWVIAFIVAAVVANGLARVLVLAGVLR